ncbi:MAG TPA: serine protease [Blastocatellia bacterium]|nr:serine protease [Blastocatellia bacterium]
MSDGHQPVNSEGAELRLEMAESAPSPLETQIEPVPGYTPRGLARIAPEAMPVSINRNLVEDASLGAFRGQDIVEVVIGDDDRKAVPDATQSPWRHICALRIRTKTNKDYVGTGWLIGPRTIMTAGHCVYMHDHGGWAKSISVIPAMEGQSQPYGVYKSTRFSAVDGWTVNRDSDFDYGVILLNEPVGNQAGWFAFAAFGEDLLRSVDANISGYPADREAAARQFFHARKIVRASHRRIYYEIDTYGGQSGAPVWLKVNGKRVAVGVHTTGSSTANFGTLITKEVFNNMRRWKTAPEE